MAVGSKLSDTAGAPVYPDYIENVHKLWLDGGTDHYPYNIFDHLEAALAAADVEGRFGPAGPGSPYYNAVVYDPTDDLASMSTSLDAYTTAVSALDPANDYEARMAALVALAPTVVNDSTALDAAEVEVDATETDRLYAALNSFSGAMFESRATQNSQYVIGIGLLYAEKDRRVREWRTQQDLQGKRMETTWIMQASQEMDRLVAQRLDHLARTAGMRNDLARLRIIANREYEEDKLRLEVEDAFYELELFKYGNNSLNAVAGLATQPPRLPKGQAALAGFMATAPIALQAGMATGNVAVGLGIAALGLFSGWIGGY